MHVLSELGQDMCDPVCALVCRRGPLLKSSSQTLASHADGQHFFMQPLYYYGRLTDVIIGLAFVIVVALCLPWCVLPPSCTISDAQLALPNPVHKPSI